MASTTSFDRKGLRFGMESSPASVEVKGSMQAEEREKRETENDSGEEEENRVRQQQQEKDSMQSHGVGWRTMRRGTKQRFTCPRCGYWESRGGRLHGGLEGWLQVKKVTLHLDRTADTQKNRDREREKDHLIRRILLNHNSVWVTEQKAPLASNTFSVYKNMRKCLHVHPS